MGLTKLILKRPVSAVIITMALIIFGISAIFSAPMELTPNMEMPMMLVFTTYPGAGPEDVEDQVSSVIEDAISSLSGVKNINSTSRENMSQIIVQLDYGTDMDVAHMDLQKRIDMYKGSLPDDAAEPIIVEMNMDMMPVIVLSAEETGDVDLLTYIENDITPEFEKLSGVAQVEVSGGQKDYIRIQLMEDRMRQYRLDMGTVSNAIGAADFSMPAGSVERGDIDMILRGSVSYSTAESLKNIPIPLSSGGTIRLSDVANIFQTTADASSISRYNGNENVSISIQKRQSASTVDVTRRVVQTVNQLNAANKGVQLSVVFNSSTEIIGSIQAVLSTLALGVLFSMLVLFIFFGDYKASLIVGSSMPISVFTALILMNLMGFSFNVLSLGGLVIGVGMMVDNSIVVMESCYRRREQQRTFTEAALEGTKLVLSSVVAGTLTTVVVYLPISFLKGLSGQLFQQLGLTIIFSLTASLFSAITLIPLLFVRLQPSEKKEMRINRLLGKIERSYGNFLLKSFRHKKMVVLVSVSLLVGSVALLFTGLIPVELIPETDQGQVSIQVSTKPGLKLSETDRLLRDIEQMVRQSADVDRYSLSGSSGSATVSVYLKSNREKSTIEWVDIWRQQTKGRVDCDISVSAVSTTGQLGGGGMGGGGGGGVQIPLQGNDYEVLKEASKQIEALMQARSDIVRVTSSVTSGNPQAEVVVDPMKASAVGLNSKQIVSSVSSMLSGSKASSIRLNGQDYDIRVEYPKDRFRTVEDLSGMMLTAPGGRQVPLLDIASIEYSNAPQSIQRKNNQYIVTVTGQPTSAAARTAPVDIQNAVKNVELPQGVTVGMSMQMENMQEEFTALIGAILTATLLVFMVMAMQFESLKFSMIVMICIPFSLVGSLLGLLLTRTSLSMPSLMGFLTLVGTVINSGILFIDTANQYRSSMDAETALIQAGRTRLRPILMTTLTTVLAMIPMGLGIGSSGELMQGMAMVIIGGMIASTILSLMLLPTFYLLSYNKRKKRKHNKNDSTLVPPESENPPFSLDDLMQS